MAGMAEKYMYRALSAPRNIRVLDLEPNANHDAPVRCALREISLDSCAGVVAPLEENQLSKSDHVLRGATIIAQRAGKLSSTPPTVQVADVNSYRYTAMSYVWGTPPVRTEAILLEEKTILVTRNCEKMLRYVRDQSVPVTLWVDAICINQENTGEKALQVSLMGDVYRFANQFFIWLGEGNERMARSFSRMRHLHRQGLFGPLVSDGVIAPKILGVEILEYIPNFVYRRIFNYFTRDLAPEDMKYLCANEWANRVWTTQEYALGWRGRRSMVLCGKYRAPVNNFIEWTAWVGSNVFLAPRVVPQETATLINFGYYQFFSRRTAALSYHFHLLQSTVYDDSPEKLASLRFAPIAGAIEQCLMNKCSDPRDKVYGIYSLMPPGCVPDLPAIDYQIDPTVLFEEFTRAIIRITGIFWPATAVSQLQRNPDLPSWVPNLGINIDNFGADNDEGEDGHPEVTMRILDLIGTNDNNRVEMAPETRPKAFALRGTLVTHVAALADQRWPTQAKDWANCFWSWFKFSLKAAEASNADPETEAHSARVAGFARFMLDDLNEEEEKKAIGLMPAMERWIRRRASLEIDNQGTSARLNGFLNRSQEDEVGSVFRYINIIGAKFRRQASLFTTTAGHLGYGFGQILEHDAIVLLTGFDDPVILRPQGENWQLVSRARVNGIEVGISWREKVRICEMETFILV